MAPNAMIAIRKNGASRTRPLTEGRGRSSVFGGTGENGGVGDSGTAGVLATRRGAWEAARGVAARVFGATGFRAEGLSPCCSGIGHGFASRAVGAGGGGSDEPDRRGFK
jgi:hypothetical protein